MSHPRYVGIPVFFAGKEHLVPSLSCGQFERHFEALSNPIQGEDKESVQKRFNTYIPIIGEALRRNYPDLTDEQLRTDLDLTTFGECFNAVRSSAGMKAVRPGEAPQPGQ